MTDEATKLCPREPTPEMIDAMARCYGGVPYERSDRDDVTEIWRVGVRAAPDLSREAPAAEPAISPREKYERAVAASRRELGLPPQEAPIDDELVARIDAALQRVRDGHALMRIPADMTDGDIVLADCRKRIESDAARIRALEAEIERQGAAIERMGQGNHMVLVTNEDLHRGLNASREREQDLHKTLREIADESATNDTRIRSFQFIHDTAIRALAAPDSAAEPRTPPEPYPTLFANAAPSPAPAAEPTCDHRWNYSFGEGPTRRRCTVCGHVEDVPTESAAPAPAAEPTEEWKPHDGCPTGDVCWRSGFCIDMRRCSYGERKVESAAPAPADGLRERRIRELAVAASGPHASFGDQTSAIEQVLRVAWREAAAGLASRPSDEDGVFGDELRKLLNRHCRENASNTPDFILSRILLNALRAYDEATRARDDWYGIAPKPGHSLREAVNAAITQTKERT